MREVGGLGAVVVGGLVCSTLFTLVVVPLLFSLVVDAKALLTRRTSPELPTPTPPSMDAEYPDRSPVSPVA